jgi:hypothetical protein
MKSLNHRKTFLIVLGLLFLSCIFCFTYLKDNVVVFMNRPFHVSRLESFTENVNKGKYDKISIITIKSIKSIKTFHLSANPDKTILISSKDFSDRCGHISKVVSGKDVLYSTYSLVMQKAYILLESKK